MHEGRFMGSDELLDWKMLRRASTAAIIGGLDNLRRGGRSVPWRTPA